MNTHTRIPALLVTLLLCLARLGQEQSQVPDQLGHVDFSNSCSAAVQGLLQGGVAMLHSFWLSESEKTFRAVLAQEPACAIATWGIAAALMANPLAGHGPSRQEARRAQAAEQSDDMAQAQRYFVRLVEIAGQGDGRPELAQARAFLAAHPGFQEPAMRYFLVR